MLGDKLVETIGEDHPVVLALPNGGVPVAYEVARKLRSPMSVFGVAKIGRPENEEFAIGAVAEGGVVLWKDMLIMSDADRSILTQEVEESLTVKVARVRGGRRIPDLTGRVAVVVDDGIATGLTAAAAVKSLREVYGAGKVIMASPVASDNGAEAVSHYADGLVCLYIG